MKKVEVYEQDLLFVNENKDIIISMLNEVKIKYENDNELVQNIGNKSMKKIKIVKDDYIFDNNNKKLDALVDTLDELELDYKLI